MNVQPLKDNVFIKPINEAITPAGIILPESSSHLAHGEAKRATVLAVGPGRINKKGIRVPVDVQIGDLIVYKNHDVYNKFVIEGEEVSVISSKFIIAILDNVS